MRYLVARGEFCRYYQPIVDLANTKFRRMETWIRWTHPERDCFHTNLFRLLKKQAIIPMTLWILKKVARKCVNSKDFLLKIASSLLSIKSFQQTLYKMIWSNKFGKFSKQVDPSNLKLEITESAVMENIRTCHFYKRTQRTREIQLSIDDFSWSYSSLSLFA